MHELNQKSNCIALSENGSNIFGRDAGHPLKGRNPFAIIALMCLLAYSAWSQSNGVFRQVYTQINGSSLNSLTNDSNFPDNPDSLYTQVITNLFEGPVNFGDKYGDRYRALLIPPMTGTYVFWVQGDDAAVLFLSSDESPNNKVPIAYNTNTAVSRAWYSFASQQSTNIFLEAGKRYYIEALHSAGTGDDAFAVGWKFPDGTLEQPMHVSWLWTYGLPGTTKPFITSDPVNLTVTEQSPATFHVGVSNYDIVTYQWQRNGANVGGATAASLTLLPTLTNDTGASFRCIVSNPFGSVTSAPAVLTVTSDLLPPALVNVATLASNLVQVIFSEPVDPANGTNISNYSINNSVSVSSARFGVSTRTIVLTASGIQRGSNYILTVNNVADRAAARNTVAPNSQQSFTAVLNGVYREIYTGIPGSTISDLTNGPAFPNVPSAAEMLADYFETADYPFNNYGQRLRARVIPPATGNYTFWLSAHDTAILSLSTNSLPSGAQTIASVTRVSDVSARQWDVQANQHSVPITLVAGQQYYIEVLMKGGISFDYPPDHLSLRWQLPDGTIEEPISAARFTPVGLNLPLITRQPATTNVDEGAPATFSVAVSNPDPVFYQWQKNGTNISGATNATYTIAAAAVADNNSSVQCILWNAQGTTNSAVAALGVTPDTQGPIIINVANNSSNRIVVTYLEPVDPATAASVSNYSIPNVTLSAPVLSTNGYSVTLTTSPLIYGSNYTLTVNRVRDRAAVYNVIATNSQFTFAVVEFFLQDIGTPAPGSMATLANGIDMLAGNNDFNGTNDSFNFAYEKRLGDFDVKVRVARLDFADTWTVASLMVREDLTSTNRYAAVCSTPSAAGTFYQYRTNSGGLPATSGSFPVNYPYTWLRLQRLGGSTINGYASIDGQTWTKLGSFTFSPSMPPTAFLGFAVSSRSAGQNVSVQFRDFMDNTNLTVGALPTSVEPLGPSSRRTGLAFTEIMYHPAPRTDGRKIEFIELYNSNPFFEDISGYRISGDVNYTFPPGTILQGGAFLVIARNPSDLQTVYGVGNVTGPYTNNFSNKSGTVRLRNRGDAILLEVNYDSKAPWPLAADGAGHSLVLARPSYGEDNALAWAQSDRIGGSPGKVDGVFVEPVRSVVINEFLAHTDLPDLDYIELYNHSTVPVDLSGCWLSDDPSTNKFRIPDGTIVGPTGFVYFTETTMGFSLSASGESIYLVNSNLTRVIDAVSFEGQENGVSTGRSPDGAPTFARLAAKTPGAKNSAIRQESVIINEIMYHPITDDENDAFVEIYNRGTVATNIGGWRFTEGIDYTFPPNTILASNGYIVIAKNVTRMLANYTNLNSTNLFGPFDGTLANSGEHIALSMPDDNITTNANGTLKTNTFYIPMDEMTYGKGAGGKWGDWSDGGGSSLELLDPHSDNRLPSNWADSDETSKSTWTIMSTNGMLDYAPGSDSKNNSLQMYLLDAGECLVDGLSVVINGSANQVPNPDFEAGGLANWNFQGTHRASRLENAGYPGPSGHSLHVVATGRGDPGPNRIYALFPQTYTTGVVGTISAKVKWLHGRPEILLRLRNNPLDLPGVMNVPKNLGSPGLRNSRYAINAGPAITDVIHGPILPDANQPVVVTARIQDPDGVGSAQLIYRVDPFGTTNILAMRDDGTGGDAVPGDGVYSATIPGQANDAMVAFYVQATDQGSPTLTTRFPNGAAQGTNECLVHFGEAQPLSTYGTYRFWITQANYNNWVTFEKLSNEGNPGTFVYGNCRVIYNATDRFGGSPFHQDLLDTPLGTNCDYYVTMPTDDRLMGADSMTLQSPGNFGRDLTDQNEQITYWMAKQLGVPYLYRRSINVYLNGSHRGRIYEDTQQPDGNFNAEFFTDSGDGDLYKVQYDFEFTDDTSNSSTTPASLQVFNTTNIGTGTLVKKLARYRQTFTKRAVNDSPHNYTNLFALVDTMNAGATGDVYVAQINAALDLKEWLHVWALERMVNNSDLYGNIKNSGNVGGQNCYIYKPLDDRWKFLIWDIDFCFSGSPIEPVFDFSDPPLTRMMSQPAFLRMYWQALEDLVNGPLVPAKVFPEIDARFAAFQANHVESIPGDAIKNFITIRHDYIQQLISDVEVDFALTSNGGINFTNPTQVLMLEGTASISARKITINGVEYPLSWNSITGWSARLVLSGQTNVFTVRGYDANGNLLANSTKTITIYFTSPLERPESSLVMNEIMYQPAMTNADYVEIFNRATNTTFDLYGYRLKGVDFDFVPGNIIAPQSYIVVVKDAAVFRTAYGTNAYIAGEFNGNLDSDGETLTLVRLGTNSSSETLINKVKYEAIAPWPTSAAATNGGVALQLIDATQDNARVSNWGDASGWKFFSYTAHPGGARLSLWLTAIGEVYIDDMRLVLGSTAAAGSNYVKNGDFETNTLNGTWLFLNSYQGNTTVSSLYAKSGTNSLRLAPTKAGNSSTAMYQDIVPTPSSSSNYTLSFWYKPTTGTTNLTVRLGTSVYEQTIDVHSVPATPGVANSIAGSVDPYPLLWINEVQPVNINTLLDNTGSAQPWIELFNNGTNSISLGGVSLSKGYTDLNTWTFPSNAVLGAGQFRVVYVDGRPQFSTGNVLHTSFRLDPTNGSIVLSRTNQILDYINYSGVQDNQSFGQYPDGQLFSKQAFYFPTPGASNNPAPIPVTINEWLASNTNTIRNPANGNKFDDWFELYNFGPTLVDLSGYYLTQDFNNKTMWRVPNGVTIAPYSFLLCWADGNNQGTNMMGNALHVNFKLSKSGDKIGLYSPDGLKVHTVTFGAQGENITQGLYPDGNASGIFYSMPSATPRTNNSIFANTYSPVLVQPANRVVNEGGLVSFSNSATDNDLPPQTLTYTMFGAPEGAQLTSGGVFTWQTTEADGPGVYSITVVVSDNGAPARMDSKTFQITVNESNTAPSIASIPTQSTYTGTLVSVSIPVTDADLPAQTFTYSILSGPTGAAINSSGLFSWTPVPGTPASNYLFTVTATDSGTPALSATQSFTVIVNAGSACGGIKGDVTPRGAPNGVVGATDWVQVGRFYAGLSDVSNACEFARADCAPKPCGNGVIGATDWVQAGRYYAGLDIPVPQMTDCPPPSGFAPKAKSKTRNLAGDRFISITNTTIARGATNGFSVILNAQGDENALGFTIHFDTNVLTYVSAQRGADAASAPQFLVNTSDLAHGLIGVGLLLDADTTFPSGTQSVVRINFRAQPGSNTVVTPVVFADWPVAREISNPFAEELTANYSDAFATLVSDTTFLFTQLTRTTGGNVNLHMMGPAGVWEVQRSSDLSTWQPLLKLTNTTGQLEFLDTTATNASQHFYRAVKL